VPETLIYVGDSRFGGWTQVRIRRGIEQIAGDFTLTVTEKWPGQWSVRRIKRGDACRVEVDGETLITGFVDDWCPGYDDSDHWVRISGRDQTGDLVDCSAIHKGGHWRGVGLTQIVSDLAQPFGIAVRAETDVGGPFRDFAIQEGETVFEAMSRAAGMRGVLLVSDGAGGLVITRAGTTPASIRLERGKNIKGAEGEFSFRDRYSSYVVKGQRRGTDDDVGAPELLSSVSGSVIDDGVKRHRPLVILAEDQGNAADFTRRAAWERNVRLGRSIRSRVTVQGWREQGHTGPLWAPNRIVHITDDWQGLNDDLLIAAVELSLDDRGTVADLELTHPAAFELLPEPEQKKAAKKVRAAT
jgi:prophage tail gpP-like protein